MLDFKKHIWTFPFIGAIITIISFFTPAATFTYQTSSYYTQFYRWMLDFYFSHVFEAGIHSFRIGLNTSLTGYFSIFSSLLIIIFGIFIIISANKYRRGIIGPKNIWLAFAVLTLILTVAWMVLKEITTINSHNHSFWGFLSPGFGIIGLFLGAGLVIIGFVLSKRNLRNR